MYRGLYINLDRDVVRRKHMEAEFERFGLSKNYQRLRAVQNEVGAVGCLRSHLKALDLVRRQDALVHILEDDSILSAGLGAFLESAELAELMTRYDMLFLDMWVSPDGSMVRRFEAALRNPGPLDLKGTKIGAASSYVVSPTGARRLLKLLRDRPPPVDDRYGEFVESGAIAAAVMVPFLTCVDLTVGATSAIQIISAEEI